MLSAATLLDVWERGGDWSPLRQALLVLGAAHPDASAATLAQLPLGQRDGLLLNLREQVFGPHLESVTDCPACGEWLELAVTTADLRQTSAEPESGEGMREGVHADAPLAIETDAYAVAFRLPTSEDLLALAVEAAGGDGAVPDPERMLLARCVHHARHDGAPVEAADLPDGLVAEVAERMEAADPQATTALALTCPACGHAWEAPFDAGTFLWAEVETWARRTLGEVHALASAYGWTEREVLALSARRRRLYLERVWA